MVHLPMSAFDELGESKLRAITAELVDRMRRDLMIGFHFAKVDPVRLSELEYQHAAELLGGPVRYTGRPLTSAHAVHRIAGGHFARRKELLRQVLVAHGVGPEPMAIWLDATEALRDQIVGDRGECH
jgi:hemoglobin